MNRTTLCLSICCLVALVFSQPAAGQNDNRFTFNAGGGFTMPVYNTDGRLDPGFNLAAGAGVNLVPHFGLIGEFGFNQLGLSQAALSAAGVPDGNTRIYSVTVNPIFRFNPRGRFDAYLIGGGGWYRRTVEFTEPTVALVTGFDPWYGFFRAPVAANTVLGSATQNKGGLNGGAGITIQMRGDSNAKFFAEARYHHIYTTPVKTSLLPVTFGFRW